jgi:hypothetical protein
VLESVDGYPECTLIHMIPLSVLLEALPIGWKILVEELFECSIC